MEDADITNCNALPNMKINLNILGALMLDRVGGHVDNTDVVALKQWSMARGRVQLQKELAQPGDLSDAVGQDTILGLSTDLETVF
jgi:hypothetical protein